jgi:hypothetical protein
MAVNAHLVELERRHRALEAEIESAMAHPSVDGLEVAELKREKLRLKDRIAKLRQGETVH